MPRASLLSRLRGQAIALCALAIALGGTAYAAVTISGQDIRDGTVSGADLRDASVTGRDTENGSLGRRELRAGARLRGPRGRQGPRGSAFSTFHGPAVHAGTIVGELEVPATGGYLIVATANPGGLGELDCALIARDGPRVDSDRQIVNPQGSQNFTSTVVHHFVQPGSATLSCNRVGMSFVTNIRITAIPVGDLSNKPF